MLMVMDMDMVIGTHSHGHVRSGPALPCPFIAIAIGIAIAIAIGIATLPHCHIATLPFVLPWFGLGHSMPMAMPMPMAMDGMSSCHGHGPCHGHNYGLVTMPWTSGASGAAVVSWLAHRYANPKVGGSNPGLDRLRIFMV